MLAKKSEKKEACRMRSLGYSLNEISDQLKVSKSSASLWLRDVHLSERAKKIISQKREKARLKSALTNHNRLLQRLDEAEAFANETMEKIRIDTRISRVTCALLYWCEGSKTRGDGWLTFTNSDPSLISVFLALFRSGFTVDESKLRVKVHLHEYHDERKQLAFWSLVTNVSLAQFNRAYLKPHTGKRKKDGYAGCVSVRYYDCRIARQVLALARAFLKKHGSIV